MKAVFKLLLFAGLSLLLTACITDFTPPDDIVQVKSGESQAFRAASDSRRAELVWYLDGEKVQPDKEGRHGKSKFTFSAEQNDGEEPLIHVLEVREEGGKLSLPGMPDLPFHSVTWIIKVLPEGEMSICYMDDDLDQFGDPDKMVETDDPLENCVNNDLDCDDDDPAINPDADEICDGVDNNCDGEIDEGCSTGCTEGDTRDVTCGLGECASTGIETCVNGEWADNTCVPGEAEYEVCDGLDNDCNGQVDDGLAEEPTTCGLGECAGTGVLTCIDGELTDTCQEGTPTAEVYDGLDNDCDGEVDNGVTAGVCTDGDTRTVACGVGACASTGIETCVNGQWAGSTCVPGEPADEICDGIDNDCNGTVDDGIESTATTCGQGACAGNTGIMECVNGAMVDSCDPYAGATDEICDDIDNDCDGDVDEGLTCGVCTDGDTRDVTCGEGECAATGVETCVNGEWADSTCVPGTPTDEICDGLDNDCDGIADDGIAEETTTCGVGACAGTGVSTCTDGEIVDTCVPGDPVDEICDNDQDDDCDGLDDASDPDCQTATGPPLPPINVSATDADPNTYDPDHHDITITWEPDTSGPAADYYVVYRATYGEDNAYEAVSPDVTDTSFEFIQTWDEVVDIIGPTPGLAGDASDEAKLAFISALNEYRDMALPTLMDFKAPAFFKVQACNAEGCSEMSDADAGQAEYIHTEEYSEVALHLIPSWGYAQLIALSDAPGGLWGAMWCGIDLCGSGGGQVMGRVYVPLDLTVNVDVVYEDYTEVDPTHPEAYFVASGALGGSHTAVMGNRGEFHLLGDFDLKTNAADVGLHMYAHIGGGENGARYHDGYADINYKGATYQFSLPIQAADDISGNAATPIEAIIPPRTDTGVWEVSKGPDPVPLIDEPPAARCMRNWEEYVIPTCTGSVAP